MRRPIADTILQEVGDREKSWNVLCWLLARRWSRVEVTRDESPLPQGRIERGFYNSFQRTMNRLVQAGAVVERTRKLESRKEVSELYPFKTQDLFLHELRRRLLPHVESVDLPYRPSNFYGLADNETFLKRLLTDAQRTTWLKLETRLVSGARGASDSETFTAWVELLVRARELFGDPGRLACRRSLHSLLREPGRCSAELGAVRRDLEDLYEKVFPENLLRATGIKSWLRTMFYVDERGPVRIKEDTARILDAVEPEVVRSLPGTELEPGFVWRPASAEDRVWRFSPELDRLMDRHVFEPFKFVRLA